MEFSEDEKNQHEMNIEITEISQGMFRIKDMDTEVKDTYLMVLVWVFSGNIGVDGDVMPYENGICYVNAIDGSIINRSLGY